MKRKPLDKDDPLGQGDAADDSIWGSMSRAERAALLRKDAARMSQLDEQAARASDDSDAWDADQSARAAASAAASAARRASSEAMLAEMSVARKKAKAERAARDAEFAAMEAELMKRITGQSVRGVGRPRARRLGDSTALFDEDPSTDDDTPDWIDETPLDVDAAAPLDEPLPASSYADMARLEECEEALQASYEPLPRKPFGLKIPWSHKVAFEHSQIRDACLANKPRCETKYTKGKRVRQCWRECERDATRAVNRAGKKPRKKRS